MKKSILFSAMMLVFAFAISAQNDTLYVMKEGAVVVKYNVNTEIDSVIFYKPQTLSLVADMLDVEFNLDGTAIDVSPMGHTVTKIEQDHPFTVTLNTTYNRNVVNFSPAANGVNLPEGEGSYYRIDYEGNTEFQDKLASGHSFETLVKFDVDYSAGDLDYETKFFSTHQSGGTGFMIARKNAASGPNGLTFLPNVATTEGGGSRWIWANSQVKPDGEKWYHLVGVWDKDAGKAYIYVNGELKGEEDAIGFYRPAVLSAGLWIAIGGDPGNNVLQNPFAGSLTIARIYDKALTAAEAEYLWSQIGK